MKKLKMEGIFKKDIELLHTQDGYFKGVRLRNNNLVIPYINIGISGHPLNPSQNLRYLNYAYFVAVEITFLSTWIKNQLDLNGNQYWIIKENMSSPKYYCGGNNLDKDSIFSSMEICCREAFLQTLTFSKLADSIWIPYDTNKQIMNTDQNFNEAFFKGQFMPENIQDLLR